MNIKRLSLLFLLIASFGAYAQSKTATKAKKSPPIDLSKFALVEGGSYTMGSNTAVEPNQKPEHTVRVNDFYIGKNEVTFEEYDLYTDSLKRPRTDDMKWGRGRRPAMILSWYDAVEYCNWLSKREKLQPAYVIKDKEVTWLDTANGYRLPTEAEWEYAARGGKLSKGTKYAGAEKPESVVWFNANSENKTQPVAQKAANELGLYDMTGNVWEWCWDVYDGGYYQTSPADNPKGQPTGPYRSMRGGAWYNVADYATVTARQYHSPEFRQNSVGFRIARNK
jgi:formylglycine-generating enzyme required for sulfatase activity